MLDVCEEAAVIRSALSPLGWQYEGGGPYPYAPVMSFRNNDGGKLQVSLSPKTEEP